MTPSRCIAVLAALLLCLTGCDPSGQGGQGGADGQSRTRFVMVSGGQTGVYYPTAGAVAKLLSRSHPDYELTVQTSGGSVFNARAIANGNADFAILQNDIASYARGGQLMFKDDGAIGSILGVAALYPEHIQIVALADSGIRTVAGLVGKRVAIGAIGSGTEANALQILEAYNIDESKLGRVERLKAGEARDYLQDERVDAAFFTFGVGTAAIQELALTRDVVFVPVESDARDKLIESHPFYRPAVIPQGAYRKAEGNQMAVPFADVPTVSVIATLVARDSVPPEAVSAVLDGIFSNLDDFKGTHARLRGVNKQAAKDNLTIPLHPGAQAYYGE
jgi:TRAP transporter TAXI family solute receptor